MRPTPLLKTRACPPARGVGWNLADRLRRVLACRLVCALLLGILGLGLALRGPGALATPSGGQEAQAKATLQQVLVFVGRDHARVLFVLDSPVQVVEVQSSPAMGAAPARARMILPATRLTSTLAAAYQPRPGGTAMPVTQGGLRNVVFSTVGENLQVVVEMDQARTVSVSEVGKRALYLDLRLPSSPPDTTLPDADVLALWINGLSLSGEARTRPHSRPRIVIDPGHGGWDTGAKGATGTQEKDLALSLARRVAEGLRRTLEADVYLTREDDSFVTLQDRAAIANSLDADLFVSIHLNAAPTEGLWGIETYYLDVATDEAAARVAARENAASQGREVGATSKVISDLVISGTGGMSRKLAHDVHDSSVQRLTALFGEDQIRDLGVKSAMFYVLVTTRMPSILYEASFLTHPQEEMRIRTPAFQQETAAAIVEGITTYLESTGQ